MKQIITVKMQKKSVVYSKYITSSLRSAKHDTVKYVELPSALVQFVYVVFSNAKIFL